MRDDKNWRLSEVIKFISIHVPRMRDDYLPLMVACHYYNFNPRPSHEGRLIAWQSSGQQAYISIHVPRMRDDVECKLNFLVSQISIHVPRMRDDGVATLNSGGQVISIHVPRMRDDAGFQKIQINGADFNPRPSLEGRRLEKDGSNEFTNFQSTSLA